MLLLNKTIKNKKFNYKQKKKGYDEITQFTHLLQRSSPRAYMSLTRAHQEHTCHLQDLKLGGGG